MMWGPLAAVVVIALLVWFVHGWAKFAGRRNELVRQILDDRARQDAKADVYRIWAEHDREAGR